MRSFAMGAAMGAAMFASPFAFAQSADTPYTALPAGVYVLDNTHASLTWKVSHMGLSNYTARFSNFDAKINLVPDNPVQSTVTVSVDPNSVTTDYPNSEEKDFDKKLAQGEKWFNSGAFPEINFVSTRLNIGAENTGTLEGDLSFLGQTKPVTLDVTYNGGYESHPFMKKPAMGFSASGVITRSDFGFNTYLPGIGDEVELSIEVEFVKADTE